MGQGLSELDGCCSDNRAGEYSERNDRTRRDYQERTIDTVEPADFKEPDESPWADVPGRPQHLEVQLFSKSTVEDDLIKLAGQADIRWLVFCARPGNLCPFPEPLDLLVVMGVAPLPFGKESQEDSDKSNVQPFQLRSFDEAGYKGKILRKNLEDGTEKVHAVATPCAGEVLALLSCPPTSSSGATWKLGKAPEQLRFKQISLVACSSNASASGLTAALRTTLNEFAKKQPHRWLRHAFILPNGDLVVLWQPSRRARAYEVRYLDLRSLTSAESKDVHPEKWAEKVRRWVSGPISMGEARRLVAVLYWPEGLFPGGAPEIPLHLFGIHEQGAPERAPRRMRPGKEQGAPERPEQ